MWMTGHTRQKYYGDQGALPGDNPAEVFDLVDERDQVIGAVRRGDAHADPSLIHRSVQVLVFNDAGHVLLQRRSPTKDLFPNFFCASASGHLAQGEDYAEAAEREAGEELGVTLDLTRIAKVLLSTPQETEMTTVFVARHDGPFTFSPTETRGGEFFPVEGLRAGWADGTVPMTPALLAALDAVGIQVEAPDADAPERPR